jgi:type II secretory pathway pseudopilin PulG
MLAVPVHFSVGAAYAECAMRFVIKASWSTSASRADGPSARHCGRKRFAFTLIELLASIALMGTLIAFLLPFLTSVRSQAVEVRCLGNIRTLGVCLRFYASDNRDEYPLNISNPEPMFWNDSDRIGKYLPLPKTGMDSRSVFWCPADDGGQQSYSMNVWASSVVDKYVIKSAPEELWPRRRIAGSLILLTESWSYTQGLGSGYLPMPTIGCAAPSAERSFGADGGTPPIWAGRWGYINSELCYARHRRFKADFFTQPKGRLSIFFDDGHAAMCSDTDLINQQSGLSSGLAAWSPLDYIRN